MPKTISELEAQRAKILAEIESKAENINSGSSTDKSPSLNDWLNAAEQVIPDEKQSSPAAAPEQDSNYSKKILKTSHSNTSSTPFFSVIILFTLFLTLVGIIYIVYNTLNKDLQPVVSFKEESTQQINQIQEGLESVQKSMATGGKSELFSGMEQQVVELKAEIASLKEKVSKLEQQIAGQGEEGSGSSSITEAMLDQKLNDHYRQFEKKLDQKIASMTGGSTLNDANTPPANPGEVATAQTVETASIPEPKVSEPKVSMAKTPKLPDVPNIPNMALTSDESWLLEQPKKNYILQLASMTNEDALKKIMKKSKLKDAKIVSQLRKGVMSYILVTGSLQSKAEALKLAKDIKQDTSISPWLRQVEDIARRVNK